MYGAELERYLDYLCSYVADEDTANRYHTLLTYLMSRSFEYSIARDFNRYCDGMSLRENYIELHPEAEREITSTVPYCSVLEMMVALAWRCEQEIMSDPDYGDRTPLWFWTMINNMGLDRMTNTRYNPDYVKECVDRMLYRKYEPSGKGGLFVVDNGMDLRDVEIWYQLNWYLYEQNKGEEL